MRRCVTLSARGFSFFLSCLLATTTVVVTSSATAQEGGQTSLPASVAASALKTPFVAAWDRFARYGDTDSAVSGKLLLTELSCTACHKTSVAALSPKRGPKLDDAGSRLNSDWIAQFLRDPHVVDPGTTMPDLFAGMADSEKENSIRALTAFLTTLRQPFPEIKATGAQPVPAEFWSLGDADSGRTLYHQIGCVACHEPDAEFKTVKAKPSSLDQMLKQLTPEELKDLGLSGVARRVQSVPHGKLHAKYSRKSLTYFLLFPHAVRPDGRMPDFQLDVLQAADIAAWLMRNQAPRPDSKPTTRIDESAELITKGRRLFAKLGCANCHSAGGIKSTLVMRDFAELRRDTTHSCIARPQNGLPNFDLDAAQQATLLELLGPQTQKTDATEVRLRLTMLQLNCAACHERDSQGGVGRHRRAYFETVSGVDIGDEGRLPPPLTGVGRKLTTSWMSRVLKGTGAIRPHMRIRMPVFPADQVKGLPASFLNADNPKRSDESLVFAKHAGLSAPGRELLNVGCVQCHPIRGESLPGVIGTDLEGVTARVQPQWFHDFLLNPISLKPRTRMPTFFPNGRSQNPNVLNGDTEKQLAAIWDYLKNVGKERLPAKIEQARNQNYELIPEDRPLILRTFMEEAGTHAIAVGLPQKVHFAFDAETIRPARAWRGRFLDARGTWFDRFTPPAVPLGADQIKFPPGVPFALLDSDQAPWPSDSQSCRFRGYRIDKSGTPAFLYRLNQFDFEDHFAATSNGQLTRRITITQRNEADAVSGDLWFRAHAGRSLKSSADNAYVDDAGLTVRVDPVEHWNATLRTKNTLSEWLVPVEIDRTRTIEVQYTW